MKRWWAGPWCAALALVLLAVLPAVAQATAVGTKVVTRPETRTHPMLGRPRTHTHPLMGTQTTSTNWSGYDVTGGPFSTVTATWTQPRVLAVGTNFADVAFWVGLDGDSSNTVEQIGTEGYYEGVVGYDAWYEMYPAAPVTIGMTIEPGAVITATVSWTSPVTFTLALVNHTSGETFTTDSLVSVPPALASAEVIAEAPSGSDGPVPLADFRKVNFSACAIDGQPIGTYDWSQINMVSYDDGSPEDTTSALTPGGAGFSVTNDVKAPTTLALGADSLWHRRPVKLVLAATDNLGGTGVAYTEYSLDAGATWTKGTTLTIAAPASHSGDGLHTVLYRSADNVGNVEKTQTCRVRIDTRSPTPLTPWAARAKRGKIVTLHYYVKDRRPGSPTATVTIRVFGRRGNTALKAVLPGTSVDVTHGYRFLCRFGKGVYRFSVSATDAAGNPQTVVASNKLTVLVER